MPEPETWTSQGKSMSIDYPSWNLGGNNGWTQVISEPFTGAWQRNLEQRVDTLAVFTAVYSCIDLISSDIAKVSLRLVEQDSNGIWNDVSRVSPYSQVLNRPNRYQNRISFLKQWVISKLSAGNAYILKERDARGLVTDLYVLDPSRTRPLVAEDGSVFYQVSKDNLAGIAESSITIPASEIIHDLMAPLHHPLCGIPPLVACSMAAIQGMSIQRTSAAFFDNRSVPGGILSTPNDIKEDEAKRVRETWQNFRNGGSGGIAVLGKGLAYSPMAMKAVDAQLIEQLRWSTETVCSAFKVPLHKISVGQVPTNNTTSQLDQEYYAQCLQIHFKEIQACLNDGLGLNVSPLPYAVRFDLDDILMMDAEAKTRAARDAVSAGILSPNEARRKFNYGPVDGGDVPYLQQQYWPLSELSKRAPPEPPSAAATQPQLAPPEPTKSISSRISQFRSRRELRSKAIAKEKQRFARLYG